MSKKMLIGVLAAVMLTGEVSASPIFAQNVNTGEYVTEMMDIDDAAEAETTEAEEIVVTEDTIFAGSEAADKNGFVIENGVLKDYKGEESKIEIPVGVTSIGKSAFSGKKIESVKIPEGVADLEDSAFYGCRNLKSVELPKTLKRIKQHAFDGCESLESMTVSGTPAEKGTVVIPGSVTKMEDFSFGDSTEIKVLDMTTSEADISNRIFDLPNVSTVKATGSTKYKVVDNILYDKAGSDLYYFPRASKTEVKLPEGVSVIKRAAFYNCKNLENITFPKTLVQIEEMALWRCEKIKKLQLPSKLSSIGTYVFKYCNALEAITVASDNENFESVDGILYEKKKYFRLMLCPVMKQGVVTVKDGMREINMEAFCDCKYVTEVRLPESLWSIGSNTFEGCSALEKIELPDQIEEVGIRVFKDCTALKSVKLSSKLTEIEKEAFAGCKALENIVIPQGVTRIDNGAFEECDNLQYVIIPESVKYIGTDVFYTNQWGRDLLIYCKAGSYAENYAKENNIFYVNGDTAKKRQTITATDFDKNYGDESFYINAATDGDGKLTYQVADESVVSVNADGLVTIKKTGVTEVEITASRTETYEIAKKTIYISVREAYKKKSQTITVSNIVSIYEGNSVSLNATTDGDGSFSYSSDDHTVAEVDASGKVHAVKKGTAHITISASETERYYTAETVVTVIVKQKKDDNSSTGDEPSKDDTPSKDNTTSPDGGSVTPGTTDNPQAQRILAKDITKTYGTKPFSIGAKANGGGKLTYKVADKKIATISKTGKIKLKNYGQTKITIKVAAKGTYKAATKTITLTVKPVKTKGISVRSKKAKTAEVKWKRDKKASGYIIQYSMDKKFKKNVKKVVISKNQTTSKKIGKLKSGKKYYVRVCAYKKSHGKKVLGSYGTVKSIKVK